MRAISATSGVIIIVGLARVSRDVDGVFLVWVWVGIVSSFVSFSGMIKVSVLVEVSSGSPVSCCSVHRCSSGISRIELHASLILLVS